MLMRWRRVVILLLLQGQPMPWRATVVPNAVRILIDSRSYAVRLSSAFDERARISQAKQAAIGQADNVVPTRMIAKMIRRLIMGYC